ncbi:MAG: FIST C-terminal domain-containing protein [Alphaproteobacteria bacterium]|nr:FIST C-terminal domain-containing protein [Alphaproteobacteria bacterium]
MSSDDQIAADRFRIAHARALAWQDAVEACASQLGAPRPNETLGIVYANDRFVEALEPIVERLTEATGITNWIGTVGIGVIAGKTAHYDEPALAVMTAALPPDSFALFDCVATDGLKLSEDARPPVGLVHVDPRNPKAAELVAEIAKASGAYLIGGLTAARGQRFDQVAGVVTDGGVSGALFAPGVTAATGLTQGCTPIGPARTITLAQDNVVMEIDGAPALDALREDLGVASPQELKRIGGTIFAGFPVPHSDVGDYLVRNLVGLDVERGWLAVGEKVEMRQPILFCRRDRAAAETDLASMAKRVRSRVNQVRGAIYVSCLARGPNTFASADAEIGILQEALGDVPLIGFYANGEISHDRIYGYTGVLALF